MNSRVHVQSFGNGKQDHEIYTAFPSISGVLKCFQCKKVDWKDEVKSFPRNYCPVIANNKTKSKLNLNKGKIY